VTTRWLGLVGAAALVALGCSSEATQGGTGGSATGGAATGGSATGGAGATGGETATGGSTSDGGGGSGMGGSGGAVVDNDCMLLCVHPGYACTGVDTENGSGVTSDITETGCTFTAMLPVSGVVEIAIDCVAKEACLTSSDGGCVGEVGACYPLTVEPNAFSYMVDNCIQGSLSCSQLFP
jgi:hypothetical protein